MLWGRVFSFLIISKKKTNAPLPTQFQLSFSDFLNLKRNSLKFSFQKKKKRIEKKKNDFLITGIFSEQLFVARFLVYIQKKNKIFEEKRKEN